MSEEVSKAIQQEEGQLFDRKSSKIDSKSLANQLIGFANADGGVLAVGISDDRILEGFKSFPEKIDEFRSFIPTWIQPPLKYRSQELSFTHDDGTEDCILLFIIEQSSKIHENKRGEVYLRRGKETKLLNFHERALLAQDKGLQRFEATLTDAGVEEVDMDLVADFSKQIGLATTDARAILLARNLGEDRDGKFYLNYAGLLLFGKNPQRLVERARTRILRFEGTTERTGETLNLIKDQSIEGPVLSQITETEKLLKSTFRDFTSLDAKTGRFRTVPEYPVFAWLEAIVNALTHREYSLFGADVQIKIFDDHVEILSPGNFPSTVKEQNIKDIHFSRNPKMARVMCDLGYVREMGEGVNRIFEEMALAGLPEPTFRSLDGAVIVTLVNKSESRTLRKEHDLGQQIREDIFQSLNEKEKAVVLYCLENGTITTSECSALIRQGDDSALNLLKKLKGASPAVLLDTRRFVQDPKAFYSLNPEIFVSSPIITQATVIEQTAVNKISPPSSKPQKGLFDDI